MGAGRAERGPAIGQRQRGSARSAVAFLRDELDRATAGFLRPDLHRPGVRAQTGCVVSLSQGGFTYDEETDSYICPQGQRLRFTRIKGHSHYSNAALPGIQGPCAGPVLPSGCAPRTNGRAWRSVPTTLRCAVARIVHRRSRAENATGRTGWIQGAY